MKTSHVIFFGHSKWKIFDHAVFFNYKQVSAALKKYLGSSAISIKKCNACNTTSTSDKDKYYELSVKNTTLNGTQ